MVNSINNLFSINPVDLFNTVNGIQDNKNSLFSTQVSNPFSVFDVLNSYAQKKYAINQQDPLDNINWDDYLFNQTYLQYPNKVIKELVDSIVDISDSDDEKAYKIISWVLENFKYKTDEENYGYEELWVPPVMLVRSGYGDCEDQAFLVHSLLLNAGIPWERVRTYGGEVWAGEGAATGGHAWTAYRRETDNEWVILDATYFANKLSISARSLMKEEEKYIDDWFYMDLFHFMVADNFNYVRKPEGYTRYGLPFYNSPIAVMLNKWA